MPIIRVGPSQVDEFVGLVAQMNPPGSWSNDASSERALLLGTHPVSSQVDVIGFVARSGQTPVGRIGVSLPHDSDQAHVGFLQAPGSGSTARALFDAAASVAAQHGRRTLIGPVDGSFWHRYRLKVRGFENRPYFTEPLNPPHHRDLWRVAGFDEWQRYRSTFYETARPDMDMTRYQARHDRFSAEGYEFTHPRRKQWDETLDEVHDLISRTYASMPLYRPLDREAFGAMFSPLRQVVDLGMVFLVRREGRAEAFALALPDHGLGLQQVSAAAAMVRVARARHRAPRYVLAHIAAQRPGLGAALMVELHRELVARKASVVGSLTREGVATESYGRDHVTARNEYVLLRRDL